MLTTALTPETPEWWREVLLKKLVERDRGLDGIQIAVDYYEGKHDLAYTTAEFERVFGGLFEGFSDNWCGVVVQAPAERMKPQGIQTGGTENDSKAWEIWQRNELDAWAAMHHTSTLATGYGYVLIWAGDDEEPVITVEDPQQVIVAYYPGTRKRAAALKRWKDEWTGKLNVTLYLPDALYKWQSSSNQWTTGLGISKWNEREIADEEWPLPNPLGVVPIVEFLNDPSLQLAGRSEIRRVIPLQKGINKLTMDLFVASEFAAFRQRWATGIEVPIDPETGKPVEAFQAAVNRIWSVGDPDAKFGEFSPTDLKNYVDAIEMLVQHVAAQSRTPRHYFFQTGQSPSGDAIKSAETGLVAKVLERQLHFGERWEEVLRIARRIQEPEAEEAFDAELVWGDPEYRTEGELTDAVLKQFKGGLITWRTALRRLGYTLTQIDDMQKERASEELLRQAANISNLLDDEEEPEAAA